MSPRTRNSCARDRPSRISCGRTGLVIGTESEHARSVLGALLPAALSARDSDGLYVAGECRTDQIRGERIPRHQDHLHQRDRRPLRGGRRRCPGHCPRHWSRRAHRPQIPGMPGPGLAVSCFPKDCQALVRSAELAETELSIVDTVLRGQRGAQTAYGRPDHRGLRRHGCRQDARRAGAHLSSPIPTNMRDSPSLSILPVLHEAGARIRAFRSRRHGGGEKADAPTSIIAATPMGRWRAPTRSC